MNTATCAASAASATPDEGLPNLSVSMAIARNFCCAHAGHLLVLALTLALGSAAVCAQSFPSRPIRIITSEAVSSPNILVVDPSLPVKSVKELIAVAKCKPGVLNYASSSVGGSPEQLAARIKSEMASIGKMIRNAGIRAE